MRDHAVVSPLFWTGDTGQQLRKDADAQRLALYLMTCPNSNMIGLYYLPLPTISHELGMKIDAVRKALRRGIQLGFCDYDEASEVVFVPEMARFQVGAALTAGDKRKPAVIKLLEKHYKCRFYKAFLLKYSVAYGLQNTGLRSPIEGASSPSGSPFEGGSVQEKDQDQEQDFSAAPVGVPPESDKKPPAKEKKPKEPRPRNPLFDAIAEVSGLDPVTAGGLIGKVAAELMKPSPPYTPEEVLDFGRRFLTLCTYAAKDPRRPTPNEIQKNIGLVRAKPIQHTPTRTYDV